MPANTVKLVQLMHLEARRDFLRAHATIIAEKAKAKLPAPTKKATADEAQLETEIRQLEDFLRSIREPSLAPYIAAVLLPKIGDDGAGVSTTLAQRFGQLSKSKTDQPFVLLGEQGVQFFWDHQDDAERFAAVLQAHGLTVKLRQETPIPAAMLKDQPSLASQLGGKYQGKDCCVVQVAHKDTENLVALAQYHPYNCKDVVSDWYAARKLNRANLLVAGALRNPQCAERLPAYVTEAIRVALPGETNSDLIRVTVAADATAQTHASSVPHHTVILLDDSGSMGGQKMTAANRALENFINSLPDDDLVSIQPFNAKTLAYRMPVRSLKATIADYCKTPATGGTPLIEALANSAIFLRRTSTDRIITEEELNNTTIALLTDGQPNGSAKDTQNAMQTSQCSSMLGVAELFLPAVSISGVNADNFMSYGLPGFQCRQLPVVLPVSIGQDSNEIFMRELAAMFHAPEAFVKTDENIDKDINHAMELLSQMRGRLPRAFIGLSYTADRATHVIGQEEQNLFLGRTRDIYFVVPKTACGLNLCAMVGDQSQLYQPSGLTRAIADNSVVASYLEQCLLELRLNFFSELDALGNTTDSSMFAAGSARFARRRMACSTSAALEDGKTKTTKELFEELSKKLAEAKAKFSQLQQTKLAEARELQSMCTDKSLLSAIELFISTIEKAAPNLATFQGQLNSLQYQANEEKNTKLAAAITDLTKTIPCDNSTFASGTTRPTRGQIATYTQVRGLGHRAIERTAALKPLQSLQPSAGIDSIVVMLQQAKFAEVEVALVSNPDLLNAHTKDQYKSTLLISALFMLSKDKDNVGLREFIQKTITRFCSQINILEVDATGNTALHRAAWYGEKDICVSLANVAVQTGRASALVHVLNGTNVGATCGETAFDNIRRSPSLDLSTKKELLQILTVAVPADFDLGADDYPADVLNCHLAESWNTPLMQLMRELHDDKNDADTKRQIRAKIHNLLDKHGGKIDFAQSNFSGNTLLHYALWFREYEIAAKVVAQAMRNSRVGQQVAAETIHPALRLEDTEKDGHCFYNAVIHSLGLHLSVQELRNQVADYLVANIDEFRPFILLAPGRTIDDYIAKVRSMDSKTTEWADQATIVATMRVLGRPIVVLGPEGTIRNAADVDQFTHNEQPGFVYFDNVNHYGALPLQSNQKAAEVLRDLRSRNSQLRAVLAARNVVGAKSIAGAEDFVCTAGGEAPHMNLVTQASELTDSFKKAFAAIHPLIITLQLLAPGLIKQKDTLDGLLELLTKTLRAAGQEQKASDVSALATQILTCRDTLRQWNVVFQQMLLALTDNQRAELGSLMQLYGKTLEGYNSMDFLRASPLHAFQELLTLCADPSLKSEPTLTPLRKALAAVSANCTLKSVSTALEVARTYQQPTGFTLFRGFTNAGKIDELYTRAIGCLTQYLAYMKGDIATLNGMIQLIIKAEPTRGVAPTTAPDVDDDASGPSASGMAPPASMEDDRSNRPSAFFTHF